MKSSTITALSWYLILSTYFSTGKIYLSPPFKTPLNKNKQKYIKYWNDL